jgi:hypothetical protein
MCHVTADEGGALSQGTEATQPAPARLQQAGVQLSEEGVAGASSFTFHVPGAHRS